MYPVVSIIVPCFNQARFLTDAIRSVLHQSFENWECVIVNDGSTDNTDEVSVMLQKQDSRIRHVKQRNRGLSAARNRGLDEARGQYIQFLDADDLLEPTKLAKQVAALQSAPLASVSYTDFRYCPADDVTKTTKRGIHDAIPARFNHKRKLIDIAERWESELSIPCHCFLFSAVFFREMGIRFDTTLPNHEDWDCWMRIFAMDPEIILVEGPLAIYRLHASSMCADQRNMWAGFKKAIHKQQRAFRHDPLIHEVLLKKLEERRLAYCAPLPLSRAVIAAGSHVVAKTRKKLPWRLQRFLTRLSSSVGSRKHPL